MRCREVPFFIEEFRRLFQPRSLPVRLVIASRARFKGLEFELLACVLGAHLKVEPELLSFRTYLLQNYLFRQN